MSISCEFHFQEGFAGETVTLAVDGKVRFRFQARTRLQTGFAQIKTLELDPGQTVTIAVPSLALSDKYVVAEGDRWLTINLVDRALVVQQVQMSPGYV